MSVMKKCFVAQLCPHIVNTEGSERLSAVRAALDNGETHCVFGGEVLEVTEEYYRTLCTSFDFGPHVAFLECRLARMLQFVRDTRPVAPKRVSVKCKACGSTDFKDCFTHFTCNRCSVVRTKVEQGLAYREMRGRSDLNGVSRVHNGHYSHSFNQLCDLRGVPDSIKKANERIQYSSSSERRSDAQLYAVQQLMEDLCSRWSLPPSVSRRAHGLFCRAREYMDRMGGRNALICMCLMHALPSVDLSISDLSIIGQHYVRKGKHPVLYSVTGIGVRGFVLVVEGTDSRGVSVSSPCEVCFRATDGLEVVGPTLKLSLRPGEVYFTDTVASGFLPVTSMGTNQFSRALLSGSEIFTDGNPIHMS